MVDNPQRKYPYDAYATNEHIYCAVTGYCVRCGVHKEYVDHYSIACVFADNSVAVSHIRALMQMQHVKRADDLADVDWRRMLYPLRRRIDVPSSPTDAA